MLVYGGVSASGAAHGLSKVSRAKAGKGSGVLGIVYIAGFLIPTGLNMDGMIGPPPYLVPNQVSAAFSFSHFPIFPRSSLVNYCTFQPSPGLCETNSPAEVFYHDLDSDAAATMVQALEPQALGAFVTDAPPTAWQEPEYDGRLAYVRTTEDRAVPSFVQDVMMKKSQAKWLVKDIETSHSPFLSRPKELTGLILDCVDTFLSAGASRLATSKLS